MIAFRREAVTVVTMNDRDWLLASERAAHAETVDAEQRYADLVDSVDGIVWEVDPATLRFLFVSKQAERILGYPVERWLSDPTFWMDHLHADDRDWAVDFCVTATREHRNHD